MGRPAVLAAGCALLAGCGSAARLTFAIPIGWHQLPARSPVKLAAVAPDGVRRLAIVETHVPRRIGDAEFARNEPRMLVRALGARDVRVARVDYAGRRALEVTYRLPRKAVTQYFVRSGELMYVVTYTTLAR